jgi:undecaprenyl diphosphate synthase
VEGIDKTLIDALRNKTKHHTYNTHKTLCIAINYGGRNEIVRAIQKIHSKEPHKPVTEKLINEHLDTAGLPNVDLIIRTKARQAQRLSGYLIRQAAYAELYFADMHYPDFDINECNKALSWYNEIASYRNFGK